MTDPPDVTVLGAGIAGLACAIACASKGQSVEVIEQAPALTEVGAGLQIAPNGGRVLDALGVTPLSLNSEAVHLIDGTRGRSVIRMPVGPGFRMVHRADLIEALASRAASLGIRIRLNCQVVEIGAGARTVVLRDGTVRSVNRLVGADGARGIARAFVVPDHAPRFTGQVAWRALVPVADAPTEAQVHMGPGRHLVCYPLRDGTVMNIVAVEEREDWVPAGWSHADDPDNLRAAFAGYARPIRALLDRVEQTHLWGLMDHGVTARWTRDACTLIGDAAHPTLPFLAQGANLALEDAWTVAHYWADPVEWERRRRPRVTRALAAAQGNADRYHLSGTKREVAHAGLRLIARIAPGLPLRGYDWLYGADATRNLPSDSKNGKQ
ncbi:FAD-dependent monooxygenase [Jannaschia donghaensis]|uniref:3-hydroxybenzoate 6-hydroxylase 1 n=1 Tax=Jannaschia donghaensis TaxID=420998 RepID=A0A0M6YH95_9RHOB|nr:FAD-dependent monooxygenase [Jannaschia donghaensis]CTQ48873.1 3-hydroxybenzoate 6-hydroxylase 1 [Jannaschia donghaensis]